MKQNTLNDYLYKDATIGLERKRNKIENILQTRIIRKLDRPRKIVEVSN